MYLHMTERTDPAPDACPLCGWAMDYHVGGDCPAPDDPSGGMSGIAAARLLEEARQAASGPLEMLPVGGETEPW